MTQSSSATKKWPRRSSAKPEQGHLKKAGVGMVKHLKEFRLEDSSKLECRRRSQG